MNNMVKENVYKFEGLNFYMNKKGVIETVFVIFASAIIAGSLLAGSYVINSEEESKISEFNCVTNINSNQIYEYVANIKTKQIYDYGCLPSIPLNDRIFFKSLEVAIKEGYTFVKECPK